MRTLGFRATAFVNILVWSIAIWMLCLPLSSQTSTATLQGVVRDPSGAVVPEVQVSVKNIDTGLSVDTKTNVDGRYTIPFLQPGNYQLAAEKAGFSRIVQPNIRLSVQQNVTLDLQLQIGQLATTLEVPATAPLLDTNTQTVQTSVDSKSVTDLPLNSRLVQTLALTVPGVYSAGGYAAQAPDVYTPSLGGGRGMTSELLVDGVPQSAADPTGGAREIAGEPPSVDAVQEFTVQINTLSAEYGRSGGGVISLATRPGTNQLHGTAREFLRNSAMDANDFFSDRAGVPKTTYQRHQYGFSVGGPIRIPHVYNGHDRTFFFVDLEALAQGTAQSETTTVPIDQWQTGDFSGLKTPTGQPITLYDPLTTHPNGSGGYTRDPFPNNIIPANRINPVAAAILQYYPEPNTSSTSPFTPLNNFFKAAKDTFHSKNLTVRVDQNLTSKWHSFWRVNGAWDDEIFPRFLGNIADPTYSSFRHRYNLVWDNTILLNSTTALDVRGAFSRFWIQVPPVSRGFDPTLLGFPAYLRDTVNLYGEATHFPLIYVAGMTGLGSDAGGSADSTDLFEGSISKTISKHNLKIGWDYRKLYMNHYQPWNGSPNGFFFFDSGWTQRDPFAGSATEGFPFASFLLGGVSFGQVGQTPHDALASSYWAGYLQDDFHVTNKLTFNLGIRYDVDLPRTERYNRMSYYDLSAPSPIAGQVPGFPNLVGAMKFVNPHHRRQTPTDWNDVGPRFGFAYGVTPNTVIRGGYGIMYDASPMQVASHNAGFEGYRLGDTMVTTTDGLTPSNYLDNPFPNGFIAPSGGNPATDLGLSINDSWIPAWKTPYVQQWNLNVQRQLPGNIVLEGAYIGNKGTDLIDGDGAEFNQLDPKYLSLGNSLYNSVPNPFYGVITDPTSPLSLPTVQNRQLLRPYPQLTGLELFWRPIGSSIYHAFTLRAEKRFSHGLGFLVAFTGSKLIGDCEDTGYFSNFGGNSVQNVYDLRAERAVSNQDVPRRLVISAVYQLPIGRGHWLLGNSNKVVNGIVGGWQVNTITTVQKGTPILLSQITNDTGLFNSVQRPNYNGGPVHYSSGSDSVRVQHWFDASAFSIAPPFTFGDAPRNISVIRQPGISTADISVFKNFQVLERLSAQFRFEAFNALNKPQFGPANALIGSGIEGQITSVAAPPRQVQLGLKLIF